MSVLVSQSQYYEVHFTPSRQLAGLLNGYSDCQNTYTPLQRSIQSSTEQRPAAFHAHPSRNSPVKTRARARKILSDKNAFSTNAISAVQTGSAHATKLAYPSSVFGQKFEQYEAPRPGEEILLPSPVIISPAKRVRSPSEDRDHTLQEIKVPALVSLSPLLRSPPRRARLPVGSSLAAASLSLLTETTEQASSLSTNFTPESTSTHGANGGSTATGGGIGPLLLRGVLMQDHECAPEQDRTEITTHTGWLVGAEPASTWVSEPAKNRQHGCFDAASSNTPSTCAAGSAGPVDTKSHRHLEAIVLSSMPKFPINDLPSSSGVFKGRAHRDLDIAYARPSSPFSHRSGLLRSKSSPALDPDMSIVQPSGTRTHKASASEQVGSCSNIDVRTSKETPAQTQLSPLLPSPMIGLTPARRSAVNNQDLMQSFMASRSSKIPQLSVVPSTPWPPAPSMPTSLRPPSPASSCSGKVESSFPSDASISKDMASRLAGLQDMMASLGGAGEHPRRRHSSFEKAPVPKSPLVGGHHLRRRVSASDAAIVHKSDSVKQGISRRSSIGPSTKGSLLPIASNSNAFRKVEELSPTKRASDVEAEEAIPSPLSDVVACVDVRTGEGDDAGSVFVEMLRSMGAKVLARPSPNCTHIIFKAGRVQTLARVRSWRPPPLVLAVGWVVRCREEGFKVDEAPYLLDGRHDLFFQPKKRRAMEPRHTQAAPVHSVTTMPLAPVQRARQLSMPFAPKVGSPLAKRSITVGDRNDDTDTEDMLA